MKETSCRKKRDAERNEKVMKKVLMNGMLLADVFFLRVTSLLYKPFFI
jgi:hypothetical protein